MIKNIVFAGGGMRCLAYIGALRALEETNIVQNVENFAGTSAGSIFATLISMGYTHVELYDFIKNFDYEMVHDIQLLNLTTNFGLDTGNKLDKFIRALIKHKTGNPELTFQEHYDTMAKKLYINAVCIDTGKIAYFSVDTHPQMQIAAAIRMSIALPLLISPVIRGGMYYIDGGALDNIPIMPFCSAFDNTLVISVQKSANTCASAGTGATAGGATSSTDSLEERDFEFYITRVLDCVLEELTRLKNKELQMDKYKIITINTDTHGSFTMRLNVDERKKLYRSGYKDTMTMLKKYGIIVNNGLLSKLAY